MGITKRNSREKLCDEALMTKIKCKHSFVFAYITNLIGIHSTADNIVIRFKSK